VSQREAQHSARRRSRLIPPNDAISACRACSFGPLSAAHPQLYFGAHKRRPRAALSATQASARHPGAPTVARGLLVPGTAGKNGWDDGPTRDAEAGARTARSPWKSAAAQRTDQKICDLPPQTKQPRCTFRPLKFSLVRRTPLAALRSTSIGRAPCFGRHR
jgi:hypothetical protein